MGRVKGKRRPSQRRLRGGIGVGWHCLQVLGFRNARGSRAKLQAGRLHYERPGGGRFSGPDGPSDVQPAVLRPGWAVGFLAGSEVERACERNATAGFGPTVIASPGGASESLRMRIGAAFPSDGPPALKGNATGDPAVPLHRSAVALHCRLEIRRAAGPEMQRTGNPYDLRSAANNVKMQ